ncbi:hypothetical protein BJ875DRAFT_444613 [Amylocarpus encephaloides]|uniref:DNA (cytosine-5-)-methyltransferase n=1 Tax=Amylocarpus encephaloides TaxID=45428 RepID=A0A9P7YBU1_9HELO|nr:hypothetical protein BJ875DRAFT_444613 [Amylocarpus encephaloides]
MDYQHHGETLPDFPSPTHGGFPRCRYGIGNGILPFRTPAEALAMVTPSAPNHEVLASNYKKDIQALVWDPWKLMRCITTGNPVPVPDGTRPMTHREIAACQGFPNHFVFFPDGVRKRIGNAVPPPLATALYHKVMGSLRTTGRLGETASSRLWGM